MVWCKWALVRDWGCVEAWVGCVLVGWHAGCACSRWGGGGGEVRWGWGSGGGGGIASRQPGSQHPCSPVRLPESRPSVVHRWAMLRRDSVCTKCTVAVMPTHRWSCKVQAKLFPGVRPFAGEHASTDASAQPDPFSSGAPTVNCAAAAAADAACCCCCKPHAAAAVAGAAAPASTHQVDHCSGRMLQVVGDCEDLVAKCLSCTIGHLHALPPS